MLLSMFSWFIDEIDNIFPEICMPDPDPNHRGETPDSRGRVAVGENKVDGASEKKEETVELGNSLITTGSGRGTKLARRRSRVRIGFSRTVDRQNVGPSPKGDRAPNLRAYSPRNFRLNDCFRT